VTMVVSGGHYSSVSRRRGKKEERQSTDATCRRFQSVDVLRQSLLTYRELHGDKESVARSVAHLVMEVDCSYKMGPLYLPHPNAPQVRTFAKPQRTVLIFDVTSIAYGCHRCAALDARMPKSSEPLA
jgi:hypothetical protein